MNILKKLVRPVAMALSLVCLVAAVGCRSQSVPFALGGIISTGVPQFLFYAGSSFDDLFAVVIQSVEELEETFPYNIEESQLDPEPSFFSVRLKETYRQKYSEKFFEEHALVVCEMFHQSSDTYDQVNRLTRSEDSLTVEYTTITPGVMSLDCGGRVIFLEVKKADVKGIAEIVPEQHKKPLKEWESYDGGDWEKYDYYDIDTGKWTSYTNPPW